MSRSKKFVSLKKCMGLFIFDFVLFSLKFLFLLNEIHGLFNFKTSTLSSKLQQEVLKFNNICVSLSSPKTDLEKNFVNHV